MCSAVHTHAHCSHEFSLALTHTSTLLPHAPTCSALHRHTSTLLPHVPTCRLAHAHNHTAPTFSTFSLAHKHTAPARSHVSSLARAHTSTRLPPQPLPQPLLIRPLCGRQRFPEAALRVPQLRSAGLMGTSPSTSGATGQGSTGTQLGWSTSSPSPPQTTRLRSARTRAIRANLPTLIFQGHQRGREKARGPLPHPGRAPAGAVKANHIPPTLQPHWPRRKKPRGYTPEGLWAHSLSAELTSQLHWAQTVWPGVSASCWVLGKSI